jgi:flagellar M-ring protein FliF
MVLNPNGDGTTLQAPQQLELTREVNRRYETLITDLLIPVLGRGNFRISSDADIDFSQSKESLVRYGQSHVLSQDETSHIRGSESDQAIGIPGALSNRKPETPTTAAPEPPQAAQTNPPGQATTGQPGTAKPAEATPSDTHKTTNFDIDKSVEFREHPSRRLRGINIAVLVNNPTGNPLTPERLQSVNKLVSSAIGGAQSPRVTVVDVPFEPEGGLAPKPEGLWWREPWFGAAGQNAPLTMAGLLALFGGVFPLLRRIAGAQSSIIAATTAKLAAIRAGLSIDDATSVTPGMRPVPRAKAEPQDVFSIEAETVQTLVSHDPARTAQVIRGWIAGGRDSTPKRA